MKSETGSGKTLAYLIPIMHNLLESPLENSSVVILTPTRELSLQISQTLEWLGKNTGIKGLMLSGGQMVVEEKQKIRKQDCNFLAVINN